MFICEKRKDSVPTGSRGRTEFCLLRHGSTDWNLTGRAQGWQDIPLNEQGSREALELAGSLQNQDFECIVSSDLLRARGTAEIIGSKLQIPVLFYPGLRERRLGPLEGKTREEIDRNYPGWNGDLPLEGLESREDLRFRAEKVLNTLALIFSGHRIIVVSHGGFIKAFFAGCLQSEREVLGNAEGVYLVWENGKWREENIEKAVEV